jgi:hypothetical protein
MIAAVMRQKMLLSRRPMSPVEADHTPIDPADTARQLALFETGNGWQHGVFEIALALLAAAMFVPLRSFLGSGSRDRRRGAERVLRRYPEDL